MPAALLQSAFLPPWWLALPLAAVVIIAVAVRVWLNHTKRKAGATQVPGRAASRIEWLLVDWVERPERINKLAGPIFVAPVHVLGKLRRDTNTDTGTGSMSVDLRRLEQDGRVRVPIFGDEDRVRRFIRGRTTEQVDVMQLPLHTLLAFIQPDDWLILNPGDQPSVELGPEQLEQIIEVGHVAADLPRPGESQRSGEMLIGEPSEHPRKLIEQVAARAADVGITAIHLAQRVTVTGETRSDPVLLLGVACHSAQPVQALTQDIATLRAQAGEQRVVEVYWLRENTIEATHLREHTTPVWVSRG